MFLLFLSVVPEAMFARSALLSPNACILFFFFLKKRHCGMKICMVGGHNFFFFLIFSYAVVLERS